MVSGSVEIGLAGVDDPAAEWVTVGAVDQSEVGANNAFQTALGYPCSESFQIMRFIANR